MNKGCRVIRGPDWRQGDKDGGEGAVGTILELIGKDGECGLITVVWDTGEVTICKASMETGYELRLYDNAQTGVAHQGIACEGCKISPISGFRWKCAICESFDLCTACYMKDKHPEHFFLRMIIPNTAFEQMPLRSESTKKLRVKGAFPGARVVRGKDWMWGNQDGGAGNRGTVEELKDYRNPVAPDRYRSFIAVKWANGETNTYRMGFKGGVDLKCVQKATGPFVYADHLPVVGGPVRFACYEYSLKKRASIAPGCLMSVQDSLPWLRKRQQGKGLWKDNQIELIGQIFRVKRIDGENVVVELGGRQHLVSVHGLTKIDVISTGQGVQILQNADTVEKLQKGHGGWNQAILERMNQIWKIAFVDEDGDVCAKSGKVVAAWNRLCLREAEPGMAKDDSDPTAVAELLNENRFLAAVRAGRRN